MKFDSSIFWLSFMAVVAAEIGCFVRTAAIVARYGSPWSVCLGTLLGNALLLVPLFIGGEYIHRVLPSNFTRVVSGLVLVAIGLLILFNRER